MKKADTEGYDKQYSDSKFWEKIGKFAKKAGISVIYAGILLFEVLKKPEISSKDKAIIIGALGYFITPLDLIPDMIPGGFVDDLAALLFALRRVKSNIDDETRIKAKERLKQWFSNFDEKDLREVEKIL
ncbi:YkvA family protein [uncultured Ilyobacter sp.]|uniref:YkvA family protein n=1 Tax=uncultured Ilyobacter sp. TaxID=544433 RepID=UPI0029C8CA2E|nr:YkvA family protein [uncultured Ilyobacter sp.]